MRTATILLALLGLCACGPGPSDARHVDWLLWHGIGYMAVGDPGRPLTDPDLAHQLFAVGARVTRSSISLRETEAGVLERGTPVFAVRGYAPTFRLAAKLEGAVRLYEAMPHPGLRRGSDLLDVEGHVSAVEFGPGANALFTRVERPERIARLVHLVSVARVDLSPPWGAIAGPTPAVVITFELDDGTRTSRALDRGRGRFADVLEVGEEFQRLVDEILSAQWCAPGMLAGC